jgi:hypothetical protein
VLCRLSAGAQIVWSLGSGCNAQTLIAIVRTRADGLIGSQSCTTFTVTSSASMPAALSILTTAAPEF